MKIDRICEQCNQEYKVFPYLVKTTRFCSWACRRTFVSNKYRGSNHHNWKGGRSRDKHTLADPKYKNWRQAVFIRDNFKCRMENKQCSGKIQAHHILRWSDYPELRYEIVNGITLCTTHHPRKKSEEKILSPFFTKLVLEKI